MTTLSKKVLNNLPSDATRGSVSVSAPPALPYEQQSGDAFKAKCARKRPSSKSKSPTARTLELLRAEGWQAQVVEKWNPHSKTRLDLFGGIDVLACRVMPKVDARDYVYGAIPMEVVHAGMKDCVTGTQAGILGVQATSGANHSSRKAKLLSEKRMAIWIAAGGRLEIWSWSKRGHRGCRKTWTARREPLTLSDFITEAT